MSPSPPSAKLSDRQSLSDIKMAGMLFTSIYFFWKSYSILLQMKQKSTKKKQRFVCSFSAGLLFYLKANWNPRCLYQSCNETLTNTFLPQWKCNLSIEHFVLVNSICNRHRHFAFESRRSLLWIRWYSVHSTCL